MRASLLVLLCSVLCVCGVEGLGLPPLAPPPPPLQPPPHHVDPSAHPLPPPVLPLDEDEPPPSEDEDDDEDQDTNTTTFGMFLGAPCEFTCDSKLHHVFCDPITGHCECEKKFPVKLGPSKGCAKPKSLGEQCFYRQTCKYLDSHASCIQINHNAICQCETGYHSVTYNRPSRKVFCTEDMALLTSDVHTLLGVCSGIALLAGLLCLVLHLYTRGRMQHTFPPGHFADASLSPPVLFTNETGVPLTLQGRPSSRSSQRSVVSRRSSPSPMGPSSRAGAARAAAILLISCHMPERRTLSLPAAGSRRPSLTSLQSTTSSVRSFSMRRFEREREQKERRQQMQMRLAQLHANMGGDSSSTTLRNAPSPRTPNSTDGLLPAVNEARELSLSQFPLMDECDSPSMEGIVGPCSSSGTSY